MYVSCRDAHIGDFSFTFCFVFSLRFAVDIFCHFAFINVDRLSLSFPTTFGFLISIINKYMLLFFVCLFDLFRV